MPQPQRHPTRPARNTLGSLLLGGLLLTVASARVATAAPPPPDLSRTQLHVLLRTAAGTPVPGITVEIVPAAADLGGLSGGSALPPALTDAGGGITVVGLGRWIWRARFRGQFQGQALQPIAAQGQAPWGRTRDGGGFPVQVQAQEEDAAPTPVVIAGTPQPDTQSVGFVLIPSNGTWAVTGDLGDPLGAPQPLTADPALTPRPRSATVGTLADGSAGRPTSGDAPPSRQDPAPPAAGPLGWWIGGGLLWLLIYGLYTWRRWHAAPGAQGDRTL